MGNPAYIIEPEWDNFNDVYLPYINSNQSRATEIFYGGSSSGKSNFIAHRAVLDVLNGGHNYLCVRKLANSVTKSVHNELTKAIFNLGVVGLFQIAKDHITCINGYQFLFSGMDDQEKIKSITPRQGVITDVWYEEATEAIKEDIKQLRKRLRGITKYQGVEVLKRIIMSFNPIYKTHWLVKEFFIPVCWGDDQTIYEDEDIRILKTTYKDNKFLTDQDRKALEDETDSYWYEVYTLGNWGILGEAIFKNWTVENIDDLIPHFHNIKNGLDFGYDPNPTAFIRSHYDPKRKKIYIFDCFDRVQMNDDDLAKELKERIGEREVVWCDNEDSRMIATLKQHGINARKAKKGKGSVLFGIKWLQKHQVIVSDKCQPVINELTTYQRKKDAQGNVLEEPEKKNDHYMDAWRYSYESSMGSGYAWA